ncbi:MAG: AI-2E family transporter [Nanoarchaeota archaeon]|nr:AI-2E family transporter [Nanoarchaeota archaeon]
MKEEEINKYLFWAGIAVLLILSYFIIKPFVIALITSFILAYLVKPVYNYFSPYTGKKSSALICLLLIVLIILLPIAGIIGGIISQAQNSLNAEFIKSTLKSISSYPIIENLNIDISSLTRSAINFTISLLKTSAAAIPSIAISILVSLFAIFYILTNWDYLAEKLKQYLPFKDKNRIIKEIAHTTNALVYGTILIGLIEFIVSAIGFYLVGVKPFLLLSLIIFFFAFIPALGPAAVWIPLALYYFLMQNYFTAIGVIIIGLIISIIIDGIIRIKFLGDKSKIHPLIMLLGVLGGVPLFGLFGFIIGPLILIYTIELIDEALKQ